MTAAGESDVAQVPGVAAEPLEAWLRARSLLTPSDPPPELSQLTGGASNVTVRVRSGEHDWVLRRPPVRGVLPTAHDMLREYRLQAALASAEAQLPLATMVEACDDAAVIGAPFYLMERLTGRVHNPQSLSGLPPGDVHQVGLALAETMAQMHSVDPERVPAMAKFLRPEPYADRQLRRWSGQWARAREASGLAAEPALDSVFSELAATRPAVPPARVVHGDYGLANVLFDPDEPTRVQAVLDWELASLGDPLADLGALVSYWSDAGQIMNRGRPDPVCHPSFLPALPTPAELVARYAESTGIGSAGVRELSWYVSLATARLGVIAAGAIARFDSEDQARRARTVETVHLLAEAAEAELQRTHTSS
jgi:aminoglycoside phosphotransferase (APT) family kinase protein